MPIERLLKAAGVALLFALCGAWSSSFMDAEGNGTLTVAIPFAFLMLGLLRGRVAARLLTLPLVAFVWFIAYVGAMLASRDHTFLAMSVGGAIGGLGVTLCAAIGRRRLLSPKYLIAAAAIGGVSALPFGFWLRVSDRRAWGGPDPAQPLRLRLSFAIWQAAVGTYLYMVCTQLKKDNPPEDSSARMEQQ